MFNFQKYNFKRYNISMLVIITILGVIGAYLIKQTGHSYLKQLAGLLGGLILAGIVSLIDYHFICRFYIVLYFLNIALLLIVKVAGVSLNYSKRWINLGPIQIQPSEISKIIMIIFFAQLFDVFQSKVNNAVFLLITIAALAVPVLFIMKQPDLSTSMVIAFTFVMILFSAGISWKIILPVIAVGIPSAVGFFWYIQQDYQKLLTPYQRERILAILNPKEHLKTMYQQINSTQAIGAGQLLGKRITQGASGIRGYKLVPINESDFIFSVLGEEFGFFGSCLVILLFVIIIIKCIITAKKAPDQLGSMIAIGVASMFMFQVFVNIGVASMLLPNTGIPLPFISQGLSSLVSSMIAIGLVLNIRLQQKKSKE